jgi:SAM-dependent methyltransferase
MNETGERYIPTTNSPEISFEHWHRYLYVAEYVQDKDVLDIASGEGFGSYYLAKSARSVVGVDIDGEAISHAKKTYLSENLHFIEGSMTDIPIQDTGVFDIIVSFESIEHIDGKSQLSFMREVRRLLKPDGMFIVSTPNKELFTDNVEIKNPFHLKEFYTEEFRGFLLTYFKKVFLLGQKIYPVSYIWTLDDEKIHRLKEFVLRKDRGGGFKPANEIKENLYTIAICSNVDEDMLLPHSIEVDIDGAILTHNTELLTHSLSWKITSPLRLIKRLLTRK